MDDEFAWACGLFEGEGSITYLPRTEDSRWKRRRLEMSSTDKDVLERFLKAVGVGTITGPRSRIGPNGEPRKDIYAWHATCWDDIANLLPCMLPWLGERRKAKAEALLADPVTSRRGRRC